MLVNTGTLCIVSLRLTFSFQSDAPQEALHVGGIVFERSVTEGSLELDVGTQRSRCSQRPSEYIEYLFSHTLINHQRAIILTRSEVWAFN